MAEFVVGCVEACDGVAWPSGGFCSDDGELEVWCEGLLDGVGACEISIGVEVSRVACDGEPCGLPQELGAEWFHHFIDADGGVNRDDGWWGVAEHDFGMRAQVMNVSECPRSGFSHPTARQ